MITGCARTWAIRQQSSRHRDTTRWCAVWLAIAIVASAGSGGTERSFASSSEEDDRELRRLTRLWGKANRSGDTAALNDILADDFINYDGEGGFGNKAEAIASVSRVKLNPSSRSEIVSVRVYGCSAVVATRGESQGTFKGKDVTGHWLQLATWVKRDDRWQAVAVLWNIIKPGAFGRNGKNGR